MAPPKLTARKVTEMRRLYSHPDSALTYADLAAMYGVAESTVRHHLYDMAKKRFPQFGVPKICPARLKALKARGMKVTEIARQMGVHPSSVSRAVRYMKVRASA